uniref:NADH-ubiquinone oxidoreductase chain 2 n=1 Tax=Varicospira cancellata TaxID=2821816 RepID=A0A8A6KP33_9CAEN|nr:NADH dehydrogenase subunit 2 [Varicospira cancellata]QTI82479.1 NADH dehydrogenase subunit 2 [Varicospira cancellata]
MFSNLPFSYMFMFTMAMGTLFSISSSHWLGIWAGLEINLIGFLPLLVYQKKMSESESAVKYFVIQALGSSLLMFGSLLSYTMTFTWDINSLTSFNSVSTLIILCGLFFKMGLFPFHFWLPSVMAGLSWIPCLLLATWQKLAPIFLMSSLMDMNLIYSMTLLVSLMAAGSAMMGGLGGINQTQIRAILGYSSINHLGWIVFSSLYSDWMMKTYLLIYIIISICIFTSLWYSNINNVKGLAKLKKNKLEMMIMLMLLSLSGMPPMLGFIPKWLIISTSMSSNLWGLLFFLILGSLMSIFYYLSLLFSLVLNQTKNEMLIMSMKYKSNMIMNLIILLNIIGGILLMTTSFLENF